MSHYESNSNNLRESETLSLQHINEFNREAALPTYDEAVGEPPDPGFKANILLPSRLSDPLQQTERNITSDTNIIQNPRRRKTLNTKLIIISLGCIIVLGIVVIFYQLKVCAKSRMEAQERANELKLLQDQSMKERDKFIYELYEIKDKYGRSLTIIENLENKIAKLKDEIVKLRTTTIKPDKSSSTSKELSSTVSSLDKHLSENSNIHEKSDENDFLDIFPPSFRLNSYNPEMQKVLEETRELTRKLKETFRATTMKNLNTTDSYQTDNPSDSSVTEGKHKIENTTILVR